MPYLIKKKENQFCVFKRDELTGTVEGESLGCHPSKREAQEQIQALYASEDEKNRSVFQKMIDLALSRWKLVSEYFAGKEEIEEIEEVPETTKRDVSAREIYKMLFSRIDSETDCIVDFYFASDKTSYVITSNNGALYKRQFDINEESNDLVLGEPIKIEEVLQERSVKGKTKIMRQVDGRVRWFSISGTSVINRVGEIDSRELFDSFIDHAKATNEYPIRMFWHLGEKFRTGQCDFLAREGNCYITSGLYDENNLLAEIEIAAREAEPDRYGESNGFESDNYGMEEVMKSIYVPVFRKGIHKEISTLVETRAASLFTLIR